MEATYSYLGDEHFVDLIRSAFAAVLERRGYQLEVGAQGPGGPHVYEYRTGGTVVAISVDDTAGEKWEARLGVESEGHEDELQEVVKQSVTRLLAELSTRLLESVVEPSCRSAVASEFRRVIATME